MINLKTIVCSCGQSANCTPLYGAKVITYCRSCNKRIEVNLREENIIDAKPTVMPARFNSISEPVPAIMPPEFNSISEPKLRKIHCADLKKCPACKSHTLSMIQASIEKPFLWNDEEYFNIRCRCGLNGPKSRSEDGAINSWNCDTWVERGNLTSKCVCAK